MVAPFLIQKQKHFSIYSLYKKAKLSQLERHFRSLVLYTNV